MVFVEYYGIREWDWVEKVQIKKWKSERKKNAGKEPKDR